MKSSQSSHFFICLILCCSFNSFQSNAQSIFSSVEKRFNQYKATAPKERIQIITDRDLYAPGELIWFHASVYGILSPEISTMSNEVIIKMANIESFEIFNKKFLLDAGSATGFVQLPVGMKDGIYYLQGETSNSGEFHYYHKNIVIKKSVVPQFSIRASFPERDYIPGDDISMTLEFQNYYNEPKRNVKYQIDFFDGNKKIPGTSGKIKKTGMAIVHVKVPFKLRTAVFTYKISAECKSAKVELLGKIPVLSDKIFMDFYPENGKVINGIDSKISFYSYDVCGYPLTVEADLLEDGKIVATFNSDSKGIGSFTLSPNIGKEYYVQLKRPLLLDKKFELPVIEAKGVAIKVISKTSTEINYNLISGYKTSRSIYLFGVSDGEIFWTSEHEIEKEKQVVIDLSKAKGRLAHFVVVNAAARIEGEHIVMIEGKAPVPLNALVKNDAPSQRSKIEVDISTPSMEKGDIFLTAVNSPWIVDELVNQSIHAISLPYDFGQQLVFQSRSLHESNFNDEILELFSGYYVPYGFGWDRVLNTDGAYTHKEENMIVSKNHGISDQLIGKYKTERSKGIISQSNLVAGNYFSISNPKYISSLHTVKKERIPTYKAMLESGASIKDVIQTMKPYNLQGSNIVFMGGSNSINFQGGALIVVDGTSRGTDASVLDNISPFDVDEIFVSTNPSDIQRYTGLNSVGLIEITLKTGESPETTSEEVDENTQFTAPVYEKRKVGSEKDFRSTLFWAPKPIISQKGSSTVIFYNSDLISNVKGKIYFIPQNGQPSTSQFEYIIK